MEKRNIFMDDEDRLRFIHDLFEFNDVENVSTNNYYHFNRQKQYNEIASHYIGRKERKPRKFLVKIHTFKLMPNHYHLLLSGNVENGISLFMRKLNVGYAMYFNQKYEREGALFQGRYKRIPIINEAHFLHIIFYIHLNCLDLKYPKWRQRELKNYKEVIKYLDSYRWSSHLDYCGVKNFPSVTQRELFTEFFGGPKKYKEAIGDWLKNIELESVKKLTLE